MSEIQELRLRLCIEVVNPDTAGRTIRVLADESGEPTMPNTRTLPAPATLYELLDQYLEWGRREGGHGGRAWSRDHELHVSARLRWWIATLRVGRFDGVTVAAVERALAGLRGRRDGTRKLPASGKTKKEYLATLLTFRAWADRRDLIQIPARDPLRALKPPDGQPVMQFRALTVDEYRKLIASASPFRAELYEAMALTGLRRGELRKLKCGWLNAAERRLVIPPAATKNKRRAVIQLPARLAERMARRAGVRPANESLYKFNKQTLSFRFVEDLAAAGIARDTAEGRASLHGMRDTASTLLQQELGFDTGSVSRFLRHASPELTLKRYTSVDASRQQQMADALEGLLSRVPATGDEPPSAEKGVLGDALKPDGVSDLSKENWRPYGDSNHARAGRIVVNVYADSGLAQPQQLLHASGALFGEIVEAGLAVPPDRRLAALKAARDLLRAATPAVAPAPSKEGGGDT